MPTRPLADRVKRAIAPKAPGPTSLRGEEALASLLRGNWTYFPSLCWRRDRVTGPGFRQDLTVCVDLALLAEVLMADGELVVVPDVAFLYRRHGGSVSSVQARDVDRSTRSARCSRSLPSAAGTGGGPGRRGRPSGTSAHGCMRWSSFPGARERRPPRPPRGSCATWVGA